MLFEYSFNFILSVGMRWADLNDPAFWRSQRCLDRCRLDRRCLDGCRFDTRNLDRHCWSDDVVLFQVYVNTMAVAPSGE